MFIKSVKTWAVHEKVAILDRRRTGQHGRINQNCSWIKLAKLNDPTARALDLAYLIQLTDFLWNKLTCYRWCHHLLIFSRDDWDSSSLLAIHCCRISNSPWPTTLTNSSFRRRQVRVFFLASEEPAASSLLHKSFRRKSVQSSHVQVKEKADETQKIGPPV